MDEDQDQLTYWRLVIRGEAGFNGHPQAMVRLMQVSDHAHLKRLELAFPEAVQAFRESLTA